MPDGGHRCTEDTLRDLADVVAAPARALPELLSRLLAVFVPHEAIVLLSSDASGGRVSGAGDRAFVDAVSFLALDELRRNLTPGTVREALFEVDGADVPTLQFVSGNGALLVLARPDAERAVSAQTANVAQAWNIVALRVQELADAAPPGYLQLAREAAGERIDALAELADEYSTTLESLLAVLRSASVPDRAARATATGIATEGMMHLRAAGDRVRTATEEPVASAFERLRDEIRPLTRYRGLEVQFVEPPVNGRALPSEVAHGARAVVRSSLLALIDRSDVGRVRVQWDCDGIHLLIDMRDDGGGNPDLASTPYLLVERRVQALSGRLDVHATPGWGTEISIAIPLDPPHLAAHALPRGIDLRPREIEVLEQVAIGRRNRDIAAHLSISENTVKFHIAGIYRKTGVHTRAEAGALYFSLVGSSARPVAGASVAAQSERR